MFEDEDDKEVDNNGICGVNGEWKIMQTVTCNVECSYVHEYFQYMITPYTDFDQGGEGKYSEFQVTGMIEGFFFGGGEGGGRGEGWKFRWRYFLGGKIWQVFSSGCVAWFR